MKGTLSLLDALIANAGFRTIFSYGEDRLWEQARQLLEIHNRLVEERRNEMFIVTTDQQRRWGGTGDEGEFIETAELGRSDAQKTEIPFATNGFPLRKFDRSVQWTRLYMRTRTVEEWANQMRAIQLADLRNIMRQTRRAIFDPTNKLGYVDRLVDKTQYPVRAFLNGDGTYIPPDPQDGTIFAANHTHYIASPVLDNAFMDALIALILEHGVVGQITVEIALAQEAAVRALPGFMEYTDPRFTQPDNVVGLRDGAKLDIYNPKNRRIGIYGAAEIWVKPYAVAGYCFARDTGKRPLAWRKRRGDDNGGFGNLEIAAEDERLPLRAQTVEREFGIGVNDRAAGAVGYIGGNVYVAPTIP